MRTILIEPPSDIKETLRPAGVTKGSVMRACWLAGPRQSRGRGGRGVATPAVARGCVVPRESESGDLARDLMCVSAPLFPTQTAALAGGFEYGPASWLCHGHVSALVGRSGPAGRASGAAGADPCQWSRSTCPLIKGAECRVGRGLGITCRLAAIMMPGRGPGHPVRGPRGPPSTTTLRPPSHIYLYISI